jgi:hypothetical protein
VGFATLGIGGVSPAWIIGGVFGGIREASKGICARGNDDELGMSLKINKIVSGMVELPIKDCDKD